MDFGMPTLIELKSLEENAALCRDLGLDFVEFIWICLNTRLKDLLRIGLSK